GIDMVARRRRGGKFSARLRHRRGQLQRIEFGDDVARPHARALPDLDGGELAAHLWRDADLGRAHDADDWRGICAAPYDISPDARGDQDEPERDDPSARAAKHARAFA